MGIGMVVIVKEEEAAASWKQPADWRRLILLRDKPGDAGLLSSSYCIDLLAGEDYLSTDRGVGRMLKLSTGLR